MPLEQSSSRGAIGRNIKREEAAGRPPAQAKAIAMNTARKNGAKIPQPARGGGSRGGRKR